jgi:hypothetical protein
MLPRGLSVTTSTAVRERRLADLLAGRDPAELGLPQAVEDAQIVGSLELSGVCATPEDVREARGGGGPAAVRALLLAHRAVPRDAPVSLSALKAWHETALGAPSRLRSTERPDWPGSAPVAFIESRLGILEHWLEAGSGRELKPSQAGALVLARLLEIRPFEEGNGRVARLAASHLMVRGGARPPILRGADGERLAATVQAAFQLVTEPLGALLDEASDRSLDVMIQALA